MTAFCTDYGGGHDDDGGGGGGGDDDDDDDDQADDTPPPYSRLPLSPHLSICPSIHLSIHPSIYLSIHPFIHERADKMPSPCRPAKSSMLPIPNLAFSIGSASSSSSPSFDSIDVSLSVSSLTWGGGGSQRNKRGNHRLHVSSFACHLGITRCTSALAPMARSGGL
jgi:hypothetical protein